MLFSSDQVVVSTVEDVTTLASTELDTVPPTLDPGTVHKLG